MKRPHILVINTKALLPNIDGATIRSNQVLRMLAQTCNIDLIYTCPTHARHKDDSPLQAYCQHIISFTTSKIAMIARGLFGIFRQKPLQCSYLYSPQAQCYIDEHLNEYDFVFINNIRAAQYVMGKKCIKIIDFVDSLSMRYENEKKKANWLAKIAYHIDAKRIARYERQIMDEFNGHFIISDIDKQYILSHAKECSQNIYVVNNSTELLPAIDCNDSHNLVFVGAMFYEPNIVATSTFAKEVLPHIVKVYPDTMFYIVGTRPSQQVRNLASPHITVTGFVDDTRDYMRMANIVVAPMISGAGVQNKILSAMAMGCCVVTTTIGAEGLDHIVNGRDIIICEQYDQMAQQIIALMADHKRRSTIGQNARQYIKDNLTYEIISKQFTKDLSQILQTCTF